MSAVPVAEALPLAPPTGRPALRLWAVLAPAAALAAAAVLLLALRQGEAAGDGAPDTGRVLVRMLAALCLILPGALLFAHLPRHPVGWALTAGGLGALVSSAACAYAIRAHGAGGLPAGDWAGWLYGWSSKPMMFVPGAALLLFPDGHLPSRRWRPWLWCAVAAPVLLMVGAFLGPSEDLAWQRHPFLDEETAHAIGDPFSLGWVVLLVAAVAGARAVHVRRRAAAGEERAQLALLARAGAVVAAGFGACLVLAFLAPGLFDVGAVAAVMSLGLLALAMGIAILRHRLLGLDVFVNRALVLSGTAVVLAALYVAAVLAVSALLGVDVELGAALPATALVAIAFVPVRDRLQLAVGRLLHGRRDEPYAAMSQLGRRLGEAADPARVLPVMAETIADVLRLPYVAVELDGGAAVPAAVHGTPDAGIALRLPLVHAGEHVGTLVLGAREHGVTLGPADRRLLEDFARRAGAAASAVALAAEVQHSRERLVTAREEERRRLRGDLHDGLGPTLAGAVLTIDAARGLLASDPRAADALLDRAAASVEGTVAEVRRVVYGLRPPALDELGLVGALEQQAPAGLRCRIDAPDPMPALPAAVEVAAFRIAQEALTNVVRHAGARRAWVAIGVASELTLEVGDDGRGIPASARAGVGLTSMRERAAELGGSFAVESGPGRGTVVRVRLPL